MRIRRWTSKNKDKHIKIKYCRMKRNGGEDMEVVRERVIIQDNTYVKTSKKKVLEAISKCNKKYDKAMKELAK